MKYIILVYIVVLAAVFTSSQTVMSQDFDEIGLAIRPAIVDVSGKAGTTVQTIVSLQNISADPIGVEIGSRSLLPNDPEIDQSKRINYDASTWISPTQDSILLDRGQAKEVTVDIQIPESAGPGGHYALITFRTVGTDLAGEASSATTANPELTTVALITVPGLVNEQADISINNPGRVVLSNTQSINLELRNSGNIHLLPSAEVEVINSKSEVVDVIRSGSELTLPNTRKDLGSTWDPDGRIGRYKYRARVSYGTPTQQSEIETSYFFVLPSTQILLLGASLVGFAIFTMFTHRRWPKAAKKAAGLPVRLVKNQKRESTEKQTRQIRKVSAPDEALDVLSADRTIPDKKAIRKILVTKKPSKQTIIQKTNKSTQRNYIRKITKNRKN